MFYMHTNFVGIFLEGQRLSWFRLRERKNSPVRPHETQGKRKRKREREQRKAKWSVSDRERERERKRKLQKPVLSPHLTKAINATSNKNKGTTVKTIE